MPIYNWFQINTTGNLTWLRKEPRSKVEKSHELNLRWEELYDEFIDTFGLAREFIKLIKLKQKYIKQLSDFCIFGDRFKLTLAELTKAEIDELMLGVEEISDFDTIIMIEQSLGFKIDTRKTTVYEYYHYLNHLSKENKKKQRSVKNG